MSLSLSHGRQLDVGDVGVSSQDMPPWQDGPIDLKAWFGPESRDMPLELEIGCGKGTFLVQQAAQTPQFNYIGLEFARAYWSHTADRCRRNGLTNVKVAHAEAGFFVRNYVPDACLAAVHIYFPDPWPKKRHHKRRLIQAAFLRDLHRVLEAAGLVRIVTDHEDYHEWILAAAREVQELFDPLPWQNPPSAPDGELVGTNFERKYRRESKPFFAMLLRRR